MRRLRHRDEAVQAANVVILVIALVIITVAVTVRLLLQPAGHHHGPDGDVFRWETNETLDRVVVLDGGGHAWGEMTVTLVSCSTLAPNATIVRVGKDFPYPNEDANASGAELNLPSGQPSGCGSGLRLEPGDRAPPISGGEFLSFCATGTSTAVSDVRIGFSHTGTDLGTAAFLDIRPCPAS